MNYMNNTEDACVDYVSYNSVLEAFIKTIICGFFFFKKKQTGCKHGHRNQNVSIVVSA